MSRRRTQERMGGMPDWLAAYRPEQWADDLDDPLQVWYFGRCAWDEARREWAERGDPHPKIQNPQTRSRGERQHVHDPRDPGRGIPPQARSESERSIDGPQLGDVDA